MTKIFPLYSDLCGGKRYLSFEQPGPEKNINPNCLASFIEVSSVSSDSIKNDYSDSIENFISCNEIEQNHATSAKNSLNAMKTISSFSFFFRHQ